VVAIVGAGAVVASLVGVVAYRSRTAAGSTMQNGNGGNSAADTNAERAPLCASSAADQSSGSV
jgi:hypothetical protein